MICFWQNSYPASEEEIAQALEGNWQEDQLFVLRQESTRIILVGLSAFLALHLFIQWGSRRAGRRLGRLVASVLRSPLRAVLTLYYRRKAVRQLQEQRRKQGLPPLENTDLLWDAIPRIADGVPSLS